MVKSDGEYLAESGFEFSGKKPIRVLNVDDEVNVLRVAKQLLELAGPFQVDMALSMDEALDKIGTVAYDAIVSAYQLPGKNGLEFLKELRRAGKNIPFVILTGRGMEDVAVEALNLGADYLVRKGPNPEIMFSELAHDIINAVERRRAYLAAWLRQEQLKAVLDSSPNAILITDLEGEIVECNRETLRLTRFASKEEVIGMEVLEFVEERDRARVSESLRLVLERGTVKNVEFDLLTRVGKGLVGELSVNAIQDSVGNPTNLLLIISDITERKHADNKLTQYSKRLEENQRFLENIFAAFPDAVTVCDLDGNIIKCNQATLDLHGYSSRNELIGVNLSALVLQRDFERARDDVEKAKVRGSVKSVEYALLKRDGDEFPAEVSLGAILDASRNSLGLVVITKDITDRKRLQEQVIVSEKLAAVGRLAATFSHDIRNPLAVIKNSACFLEMRLQKTGDEKVLKHLGILKEEINYAGLMVNDLLDFTRKSPPRLQEADLNETVRSALSSVSVPANVKVVFEPGELQLMLFDQAQLQRVFMNLIMNAFQAMPEGGRLTIVTGQDGGFADLSFTDTGVGIGEENLRKLFTPFFTTKVSGVGLGLSICRQIVEGHGGEVAVRSKEGCGSTFTVKLPIRRNEGVELQVSDCFAVDGVEVRQK